MGYCESRPSQDMELEHIREKCCVNDKKFIYRVPALSLEEYSETDYIIQDRDDQHDAIALVNNLEAQITEMKNLLLRIYSENYLIKSKLVIEIQKGKHICPNYAYVFQQKPYVKVTLAKNIVYVTSPGALYLPNWYSLYTYTDSLEVIKKIIIEVYFENGLFNDKYFGCVVINMNKLTEQNVIEHWFPLTCEGSAKIQPEIRIRVQAIVNTKEFYARIAQKCKETIENAEKIKEIVEERLRLSYSNPEENKTSLLKSLVNKFII